MYNIKKLPYVLTILIIVSALLISCSSSEGTGPSNKIDFIMHFQDNYIMGNGWVLLEIDRTYYLGIVDGDGTLIFEDIDETRGNIYIIKNYYWNDEQKIYITYNEDVSLGEWYLIGDNYIGDTTSEFLVNLEYPEDEYSECLVSCSKYSYLDNYIPAGNSESYQENVYYLDQNNNISFFNAINDESNGYCSWAFELPFTPGVVNNFNFELDTPMSIKSISSSINLGSIYLNAYRNNMFDYITIDRSSWGTFYQSNFDLFYAANYPYEKIELVLNHSIGIPQYSTYSNIYNSIDDIPNQITFPTSNITATYNDENNSFENIVVTGVADQIAATWGYGGGDDLYVGLIFYTRTDKNSIQFPSLPEEVLTLVGINEELFGPKSIKLEDYDTCDNKDDIINMVFKQGIPYKNFYNSKYEKTKIIVE